MDLWIQCEQHKIYESLKMCRRASYDTTWTIDNTPWNILHINHVQNKKYIKKNKMNNRMKNKKQKQHNKRKNKK